MPSLELTRTSGFQKTNHHINSIAQPLYPLLVEKINHTLVCTLISVLKKIWLGGGAYSLEKDQLYDLRDFMSKNPDEFRAAIEDKSFKKHFKQGLQGEKNKIIPKEFKEAVKSLNEIANKQFYYMSEHSPDLITSPDLLDITLKHWRSAKKVRNALIKGMFRS